MVTVGGWGHLLGDEGSGYRIGLDGLRGVVRASDGREPRTTLTRVLLQATGEAEPRDLVEWAARATKGEIAALSVLVAREARAGDGVAARVIHRALGAIREHLVAVLEGVGVRTRAEAVEPAATERVAGPEGLAVQQPSPGWEGGRPAVAMVGGLIDENGVLMEAVRGIALDLDCDVHAEPVVPERGALSRGIRMTR